MILGVKIGVKKHLIQPNHKYSRAKLDFAKTLTSKRFQSKVG